jgi:hypothetical protein
VKPTLGPATVQDAGTDFATLGTTVSANGSAAGVWFEYGPDTNFGTATPSQPVAADAINLAASATLTNLEAGRTYQFRGVASNANGTVFGAAQSFTTGFPPPSVVTGEATPVTSVNATITGTVNPRGRATGWWVEYGPGTNTTNTTRAVAADGAETYTSFSYTSPNNNGGSGFGPFTGYVTNSSGTRGTRVLVTSSSGNGTANRMLDGTKSFGLTAGTSTTRGSQSGYRAFSQPRPFGTFSFALRCDVDNSKGFTGLNLKSQTGTSFGAGELVSVGMTPAAGGVGGNNGLLVTDAAGQRMLDFGMESRGAIFDITVDFDTLTGAYTLRATRRADATNPAITRTASGQLKLSGTGVNAAALGFLNANYSGATNQNLIFDSLSCLGSPSAGAGTSDLAVSQVLSGLTLNATHSYRIVASNQAGTMAGAVRTFLTATDLVLRKSGSGPFPAGGNATFTIVVSNAGSIAGGGTLTVTEQPPAALTITQMGGDGWTFNPTNLTCTTTNIPPPGGTLPPITVQGLLATGATGAFTNAAALSGGGDGIATNNAAAFTFAVSNAATGIEAWRQTHFGSAADSGEGADTASPAGDGMPNLVKYALGLAPTNAVAPSDRPSVSGDGPALSLTFRRARGRDDITMTVEAAGSIAGAWTNIWTSATNPLPGPLSEFVVETVTDPVAMEDAPEGRRHLRLKVTRP